MGSVKPGVTAFTHLVPLFNAKRERITNSALPARGLLPTPNFVVRESCGAYAISRPA